MKLKELIILSSIVLFDLITKLTANYYLPFQESVHIFGDTVSLYLTYNEGATGGQADYILEENNKNLTIILTCVSGLILLSYFFYIRGKKIRTIYKVLIGVAIYLTLSVSIELILPLLINVSISSWTTSIIGNLTGLALYGSLFFLSKNKWIRLFALMILACGLGNLLSHFYLPYRVIDFISVEGSYDLLRIGVFNFADLAFDIGAIGLIISSVYLLFRRIMMDKSQSVQTEMTQKN
jgi:lipoprotein signal peptidase